VRGTAKLRGKTGGFASERAIAVDLPAAEPKHDAIASLWARRKIADLVGQDYVGAHFGTIKPELREQITRLGLEHQLMTDFTSLVAVEERVITSGGKKRRIEVPLEMPEGVSHEGVQGRPQMLMVVGRAVGGVPGGVAGGVPGGVLGGTVGSVPSPVVVPRQFDAGGLIAPPPAPRRIRVGPEEVAYSSKLDPELVKLAAAPTDGEVAVKVLLSASSPAILMALRRAGLTVVEEPSSGLMTAGRIAASRIKDLAAVPEVRYIVLWKPGP
jgi:Ca-activated chloride channel family protein